MFAVVVLPWFVAAEWAHPGFLHYFFVVQQLQRFASCGFTNAQPFWFYAPVLFLFTLPWSGWWLANLRKSTAARSSRATAVSPMCV